MPGILPREGFYIDPLITLARKTILHPIVTIPITVLYYYLRSVDVSIATTLEKPLLATTALSLTLCFNDLLTHGSTNNWVSDETWDWSREIVVVTGGSGGIGGSIVQRLAADGVQVVVVDVIEPTYSLKNTGERPVFFYRCDSSDESEIQEVCLRIRGDFGCPTVLGETHHVLCCWRSLC